MSKQIFSSTDGCKVCDTIELFSSSNDNSLISQIVDDVVKMETEFNRIHREHNEPEEEIDTVDVLKDAIVNDTHNFLIWVETKSMDLFDYERFEMVS